MATKAPVGYCNLLWEFVPELQHSFSLELNILADLDYPERKSNKTQTLGDTAEKGFSFEIDIMR